MDIDRQIAEKVMGWKIIKYDDGSFQRTPTSFTGNGWQPSTRIDHAFEVVEKMIKDNKCSFDMTYHCELGWRAVFS